MSARLLRHKDWQSPVSALPGTYVLILRVAETISIRVGSLGQVIVETGWYVYVGSALGPGGLRGRLEHHLKPVARPHWHIDYLRQVAQVVEIRYVVSSERLECAWARQLGTLAGITIPLKKFGASDCNCPAHLFYSEYESLPAKMMMLDGATHKVTITGREWMLNDCQSLPAR